ncbi:hypothetical protein HAX54_045822 [Datura stramonium]|uniref:DUF7870 domain-containing protein n=1 Tax=Datura stramonium TaxID=4076 RepID=A0ABS8SQK8_DATST|nr:hypothetical protein [Datura stramonium]
MMRYKAMNNMLQGFYNKQQKKMRGGLHIDGLMEYYDWETKFVIIRINHSWVLKFMARATILALVIVSLPWINTIIGYLSSRYESNNHALFKVHDEMANYNPINLEFLPIMFQDLANEGLLRMGDRSLLFSNGNEEEIYNSQVVKDYNPDLISFSDSTQQNLVPNETFDIAFAYGYPQSSNFIERALKVGGILVVPLMTSHDNHMVDEFPHPSNYKIVYVRKFDSTIVAMKKTKNNASIINSSSNTLRHLNALSPNNNAEKVSTGSSSGIIKLSYDKEHFIMTSLSDHHQHESKLARSSTDHYQHGFKLVRSSSADHILEYRTPNKGKKITNANKEAVLKKLEDVLLEPPRAASGRSKADVVEEMVKNKSIRLIDELFLECKHQGIKKSDKKNRRAYWECLSLYGLLRDEGIAVHQWWG